VPRCFADCIGQIVEYMFVVRYVKVERVVVVWGHGSRCIHLDVPGRGVQRSL